MLYLSVDLLLRGGHTGHWLQISQETHRRCDRSGARKLAHSTMACVYMYINRGPRAYVITIRDSINFALLYYYDLIIAISK